jgi:phosphoribosylaminoimidazole-succinocarboxamide synthase
VTHGALIYEGKAKKIFSTTKPDHVVLYFKDDATAFNAQKRGTIVDKGIVNNKVSSRLFQVLEQHHIQTHFIEQLSDREMLVKKTAMIPLEVVVRNMVAGSLVTRFGLKEGEKIDPPLVEFYYKNDALGDPLVSEEHIRLLRLATPSVVEDLKKQARQVNEVLVPFLKERNVVLVDFKLEFGVYHNKLILADEISPDTCRLRDAKTGAVMDKDRFRLDMGQVEEAYQEVLRRVCGP